jgi:hypothetical protein
VVEAVISGLTMTNIRIEADIVTQGDAGGVIFRDSSTSAYRMTIGTNGTYNLVTSTTTLANGSSPAIKQGNNVSNHLTITAIGTHITVAVNSTTIINIHDSSSSSGDVGAIAYDYGTSTTTTCVLNVYADQ